MIFIFIIVTGVLFTLFIKKEFPFDGNNNREQVRQAIFLTNGQIYFGEVKRDDDKYLVVRSIYYLKAQDQLDSSDPDRKISIIKLGDEIHGPEDEMYINREQVVYYENMRKDSKINEAINRFLENKKKI